MRPRKCCPAAAATSRSAIRIGCSWTNPRPIVRPDRLADDPLGAIVLNCHQRGYHVGPLDAAREAFDRVLGPLDTPWQHDTDD